MRFLPPLNGRHFIFDADCYMYWLHDIAAAIARRQPAYVLRLYQAVSFFYVVIKERAAQRGALLQNFQAFGVCVFLSPAKVVFPVGERGFGKLRQSGVYGAYKVDDGAVFIKDIHAKRPLKKHTSAPLYTVRAFLYGKNFTVIKLRVRSIWCLYRQCVEDLSYFM